MNEELTVIFFSCHRLQLLYQAINAFLDLNTYPFVDFIIVNDSGDPKIWKQIENTYPGATFVFNKENVGLIKSVDLGYEHIKTEYFFHCEDDWMVTKGSFIEQSLAIMKSNPKIEEVWLADYNVQPFEPEIYHAGNVDYRLIGENHQKGMNGYNDFAWHGFATACGMKRLSDYKKVGPYADIPWQGTIWHREQAIGERYHQLSYRTAVLMDEYAVNIGYGLSEYITGNEK